MPVTGDSYSSGIIIDNESLAKVLTIEIVFYTKLYDIISDICEEDSCKLIIFDYFWLAYSSATYKKYSCRSIVYPHEIRPILI